MPSGDHKTDLEPQTAHATLLLHRLALSPSWGCTDIFHLPLLS